MESKTVILITDNVAHMASYAPAQRAWTRTRLQTVELHAPPLPKDACDLKDYATDLAHAVREKHPAGIEVMLVIPSSWCLIKKVQPPADATAKTAAQFEFEQFVPCTLEQLTCAVTEIDSGRARVYAIFTEPFQVLFQVLEEKGVSVASVTVDAATVATTAFSQGCEPRRRTVLLDQTRRVAVTHCLSDAAPDVIHQSLAGAGAAAHFLHHKDRVLAIRTSRSENPPGWRHVQCLAPALSADDMLHAIMPAPLADSDANEPSAVATILDHVANTDDLPDLRTGHLAYPGRWRFVRRRLWRCAVLAAIFLAVTGLRIRLDNAQYAAEIDALCRQRAELFQWAFPGAQVRPSAALQLRSERIKLEGLTEGTRGDLAELRGDGLAAFELLHRVASTIPDELKVNIQSITLEPTGIKLQGQTTSHNAAGDLVLALNATDTLQADPPRTKLRDDKTVDFQLTIANAGNHEGD